MQQVLMHIPNKAMLLESQDYKAQPIILRLSSPDYITNAPGRSCTTLADCTTVHYASSCLKVLDSEGHKVWHVLLVCYLCGHCGHCGKDCVPLC